jgi:hypothetical protein
LDLASLDLEFGLYIGGIRLGDVWIKIGGGEVRGRFDSFGITVID